LGSDIYVAGYENDGSEKMVATVWKNGSVLHRLSNGEKYAEALSVFVK
jgi:hypothetical protein